MLDTPLGPIQASTHDFTPEDWFALRPDSLEARRILEDLYRISSAAVIRLPLRAMAYYFRLDVMKMPIVRLFELLKQNARLIALSEEKRNQKKWLVAKADRSGYLNLDRFPEMLVLPTAITTTAIAIPAISRRGRSADPQVAKRRNIVKQHSTKTTDF